MTPSPARTYHRTTVSNPQSAPTPTKQRGQAWMVVVILAIGVLVALWAIAQPQLDAWLEPHFELREQQKAVRRRDVAEAREHADAIDASFRAALQGTSLLAPMPDRRCPLTLVQPFPMTVAGLATTPTQSASAQLLREAAGRLEQSLDRSWGREAGRDRVARPGRLEPELEVLFYEHARRDPALSWTGRQASYTPGLVRGRALLFDPMTGRFVCGADVEVTSPSSVNYRPQGYGYDTGDLPQVLRTDLQQQLQRAIATSLVVFE